MEKCTGEALCLSSTGFGDAARSAGRRSRNHGRRSSRGPICTRGQLQELTIVLARHQLSAHDALHLAVMAHHRVERILSFDAGFDGIPGVERIHG